ncbi:MAG: valine--tRNA ligase [Candidatus Omnitrophica bacterium]|nr:valine--tRNA ligase [Candidatus Omnitrophota bacterium]
MTSNIPPAYNPKLTEEKWYNFWETEKLFHAEANPEKKPYCIVIPPPNVTGILHMGHALNNTIQDILIRYKRMKGFESLWMPGTDHAGIATQNVVEKELAREGKKRQNLGREKFIERVWQWKEKYGSTIITQLRKLGSSCDWDRLRFTMDEDYSRSVSEVFLRLYEKGLIYRGNYIVNWCPRCQTALSDEEAPHKDMEGLLYYIKYPFKTTDRRPQTEDYIVVATTRPETMLGDVAVAVNPKDKRYKNIHNETIILPLVGRELKIIKDAIVEPEFGTGAVKVTPAHDPNDFAMAKKHGLEPVLVMNPDGTMNKNAGEYAGMDRFEAREAIIEDLKERGLLVKIDKHPYSLGHCYRCHTIVEPYLSKQWFVSMKPLAKPAIEAVRKGRIKFYPERWTRVYLNWMENIQDWCISRQIWWGHRLPVYYCKNCVNSSLRGASVASDEAISKERLLRSQKLARNDEIGIIISRVKPEKCPDCGSADIYQDEDVLDTWFSSWLWPFATFGWPQAKKDLKYFYPTSALITAQEIIFFWVARMIMAGLEFMKTVPFRDVYIHGTVRDDTGKKMSKSLGNIIDPLDIINEFGADALRFSIISITAAGQDVFLSRQKFELGRNFANKIWNASRFIIMNLKPENVKSDLCVSYNSPDMNLADKWILSRFYQRLSEVETALESYRFNEAASVMYEFFWHEFCDWYIEFSKPSINETHTQIVLYKVLEKSLRVLHPFMPFITEEIWHSLLPLTIACPPKPWRRRDHRLSTIMSQPWPHVQKQMINKKIDGQMQVLIDCIVAVRNIRAAWNINPSVRVDIFIKAKKDAVAVLAASQVYIKNLARVEGLNISGDAKKPPKSAAAVLKDIEIYVPLERYINLGEERQRLSKKIEEICGILKGIDAKLSSRDFLKRAPKEVVEAKRQRKAELSDTLKRLEENYADLG